MARKLRLEFPGTSYRVINRGNYRANLFKTETTNSLDIGRPVYVSRLVSAVRREQPR